MGTPIPTSPMELLAAQLEQRAKVILNMTEPWSASQALTELHEGGPCGLSLIQHLIEVTRTTLAALDMEIPFPGNGDTWVELRSQFESVAAHLAAHVRSLPVSALQAEPAIEILPEFEQSLATRQAFLMGHIFHLAYHAGQLGSLVTRIGTTPPKRGA